MATATNPSTTISAQGGPPNVGVFTTDTDFDTTGTGAFVDTGFFVQLARPPAASSRVIIELDTIVQVRLNHGQQLLVKRDDGGVLTSLTLTGQDYTWSMTPPAFTPTPMSFCLPYSPASSKNYIYRIYARDSGGGDAISLGAGLGNNLLRVTEVTA